MTKSSLREQFEQLAQRPAAPRNLSGSPADLKLTVPQGVRMSRPVTAIKLLRDSGVTLLEAKRAYEALLGACELRVHLPAVTDASRLPADLAECGITVHDMQHALA